MSLKLVELLLEPLDVLLFRDGRPFTAGGFATSGLPTPQSLAGALRTFAMESAGVGFADFRRELEATGKPAEAAERVKAGTAWVFQQAIEGPWLCRKQGTGWERLVAAPADLVQEKREEKTEEAGNRPLHRLKPGPDSLPGWTPPTGETKLRPAFDVDRKTEKERVSGYLSSEGLKLWLDGKVPKSEHLIDGRDLYDFERRTGIGIGPDTFTAEKGMIFGVSFLSLKPNVGFTARWRVPEGLVGSLDTGVALPWGGEGRRVRVSRITNLKPWPATSGSKQVSLLTTPALFDSGWRPTGWAGRVTCFLSGGEQHISGWDLARGRPKPARLALSAGAVHYLTAPVTKPFSDSDSLSDAADDRLAGWGHYLMGDAP